MVAQIERKMIANDRGFEESRTHLGIEFVIWTDKSTWFWFLTNPHTEASMIGATTDEARAILEARFSIEDILAVL